MPLHEPAWKWPKVERMRKPKEKLKKRWLHRHWNFPPHDSHRLASCKDVGYSSKPDTRAPATTTNTTTTTNTIDDLSRPRRLSSE